MEEGDNNTTDLFGEGGNDGFERELVLDRSIAQEDAVVALREASDETTFVDNCLTLISCLTCHTMTEVMKESDRFIGAANSFPEVMKNWPSKDDILNSVGILVFRPLPNILCSMHNGTKSSSNSG